MTAPEESRPVPLTPYEEGVRYGATLPPLSDEAARKAAAILAPALERTQADAADAA